MKVNDVIIFSGLAYCGQVLLQFKAIKNEFPEIKGFSERNIGRMKTFYHEYTCLQEAEVKNSNDDNTRSNLPQPVAKLGEILKAVTELPWGHNFILMEKTDYRFDSLPG